MIEVKAKLHDNFSVEFKHSFVSGHESGVKCKDFIVNTWIFVPNALDINPSTYDKQLFWRDTKSNLRLITPDVALKDVKDRPLAYLKQAMERMAKEHGPAALEDFDYHIKMFCSISKSAMRDAYSQISRKGSLEASAKEFVQDMESTLEAYWSLDSEKILIEEPKIRQIYDFGDEYLGTLVKYHTLKVLACIEKLMPESPVRQQCIDFTRKLDNDRRVKGFPVAGKESREENNNLVHRNSALKKYFESGLFVSLNKKKDGVAAEQTLYAVAAGLAMIFATVVSFSVQRAYGSLSIPLFFALIFSYMIKDRIKELTRYWFVHKLGKRYFDNKSKIFVKGKVVGMVKEGVDFISENHTPGIVMELRNRNSVLRKGEDFFDEHIILYRKLVSLYPGMLDEIGPYPIEGINDIFRIHLSQFTQKMDNPEQRMSVLDKDGNLSYALGLKSYPINIIQQLREGDKIEYRRLKVILSRKGIYSIEEFKA